MQTTQQINEALERVHKEITLKTAELGGLREAHQTAKATYENTYSRFLLETKAKNPTWTVQEVKAQTINLSYTEKLEAIKKESAYRKVLNELRALESEYEGLKEQAYNIRAEIKRL